MLEKPLPPGGARTQGLAIGVLAGLALIGLLHRRARRT